MTTYALLTVPGHGHVNPTLALAQELVARGEHVIYYQTEEFRSVIEATGATFREYKSEAWEKFLPSLTSSLVQKVELKDRLTRMVELTIESIKEMPSLMEQMKADHIDCILYDRIFMQGGAFVSKLLHLPAVQFNPSFVINERVFRQGANQETVVERPSAEWWTKMSEQLARECETYHIPRFTFQDVMMRVEDLNIAFLPRAFQFAGETFDERYLFVGPSIPEHRYYGGDFPLERLKHPLLYISLGTAFNKREDFYRQCFEAFGQSEWQVALSFGTRIDPAVLSEPPANFLIAPHVPQLEVLERTDLFVSHGGMNSIMESLWFGVPLVVVPQMMEQEMNACRVQELGLGLMLDRETLTPEKLRAAVDQVAGDPAFRSRVQEMQQEIRQSGGYRRAADAIISYMQRKSVAV